MHLRLLSHRPFAVQRLRRIAFLELREEKAIFRNQDFLCVGSHRRKVKHLHSVFCCIPRSPNHGSPRRIILKRPLCLKRFKPPNSPLRKSAHFVTLHSFTSSITRLLDHLFSRPYWRLCNFLFHQFRAYLRFTECTFSIPGMTLALTRVLLVNE